VTGDILLLFPAKVLLYSLSICYCLMENHSSEVKIPQVHLLMTSIALELWPLYIKSHQKSMYGLTGDGCLVLPAKLLLYSLSICYFLMENQFSEVKKTTN